MAAVVLPKRIYEGSRIPQPVPTILEVDPAKHDLEDILRVNFGPNHPSTHGVLRLVVVLGLHVDRDDRRPGQRGRGLLVARLRVPPFLATFSVQGITYGISLLLSEGSAAVNVPNLANMIGNGSLIYWVPGEGPSFLIRPQVPPGTPVYDTIPTMVAVTAIFVAVAAFLLKRTRFGRHTYAIGGNIDAAIRSGINTKKHLVTVYVISSFLATLSGIIYMMEYVTGKSDAGSSFMLDSVVAVVIGGASLFGGTGTVWRTILGVFILSVLEMGLKMMGVQTFDKYIAVGLILIFAVLVDQFFPELVHTED